jgi:hypothetical protein
MMEYNADWLSSIQVEYDAAAMENYGGVPEVTNVEFWNIPDCDVVVDIITSGRKASSAATGKSLVTFDLSFTSHEFTPWITNSDQDKPINHSRFWDWNHLRGVDDQDVERSGVLSVYGILLPMENGSVPAAFTVCLFRTPHEFNPIVYSGILNCAPFDPDTTTTTWDQTRHELSWLYNGHSDCNQDGKCKLLEDSVFARLFDGLPGVVVVDETSVHYLASISDYGSWGGPMLYDRNNFHDGYNMYYRDQDMVSPGLTYAGHVALTEGVGNRYTERLRFSFQYPPEVQPGDALYYRPTLDGAEGGLAWLYTVPAG